MFRSAPLVDSPNLSNAHSSPIPAFRGFYHINVQKRSPRSTPPERWGIRNTLAALHPMVTLPPYMCWKL
jgi:hypothetical protein